MWLRMMMMGGMELWIRCQSLLKLPFLEIFLSHIRVFFSLGVEISIGRAPVRYMQVTLDSECEKVPESIDQHIRKRLIAICLHAVYVQIRMS